jgi:hypothetical protein
MITRVILDFDTTPESVRGDGIYRYRGKKDLLTLKSLEAVVDTRENSLSAFGDLVPNLEKLRLNNSIIPDIRDIGCRFVHLRCLWLARCGLASLNGVSTISRNLEELYLAYNHISDVSDLMGMEKLRVLDLAENQIQNLSNIQFLTCCSSLLALTLAGNPCVLGDPNYEQAIARLVPQLTYLDEKRIRGRRPPMAPDISPHQSVPVLDFRGGRIEPREPDSKILITDLIGDKINNRPPTARGNPRTTIRSQEKSSHPEVTQRNAVPPRIVRPLSSARRIKMK